MPKLISPRVKHRLAALDLTTEQLAKLTDINSGSLRNALNGLDQMRLSRIYRIARCLIRDGETVEAVVADIMAGNDGVPDEPPTQPTQPKGPVRRQETEKTKAPRRTQAVAS